MLPIHFIVERKAQRIPNEKESHFVSPVVPVLVNHVLVHMLNGLTLTLLMSYIYMEHLFLMFLDHTQPRRTVGRTPLDE